jgi:nucleotide-binding universal stress UspA family protein
VKLLSKILLATDFSEASAAAAKTATTLAATFGSEILPLHVLRDLSELVGLEAVEGVRGLADRKLRALSQELTGQNVSVAPPIIAHGLTFQQILNHANAQNANVILMGAGERGPDGRVRLGITPERVIRRSVKPVWVVQPGSQPSVRRVVCAVDFSDHSRRALTNAVHLARSFDAELTVLTVVESLETLLPADAEISASAEVAYAQMVQDRFEELKRGLDVDGVKVEEVIRHGRPAEEIVQASSAARADLLVMGSSGRSGLARFFMGSVAQKVLRRAPCSVLAVKAEHVVRVEFEAKVEELKTRFAKGQALLAKGRAADALVEFEAVRSENPMAAPVWEALAAAHRHLGHEEQAAQCESRARYVRETLWKQMVESDVRTQHEQRTLVDFVRNMIAGDRT